jgi:hypothetical protein
MAYQVRIEIQCLIDMLLSNEAGTEPKFKLCVKFDMTYQILEIIGLLNSGKFLNEDSKGELVWSGFPFTLIDP